MEESWSTGRTIHFRSQPLSLTKTATFRDRVISICRKLLARREDHLASQIIPVLDKGCDIARMGYTGSPSPEFVVAWDAERQKCLAVLGKMMRDFTEPLIHFQIRRTLMRDLRYGKDTPLFRDACRKVLAAVPDSLDLRIARTAFGDCYDEFERDTDDTDRHTFVQARWETFIHKVADAVHDAHPNAAAWLAYLSALDSRWRGFTSFAPNFRHLLVTLAKRRPAEGITAAEMLLADPSHPLVHAFDAVAMSATKIDASARLRLIRAAADNTPVLQACAVACCSWWRREGALPEEAWQTLERLAPSAPPNVATSIVNFVWWNDHQATLREWHLISALTFAPTENGLAGHIAARASDLIGNNGLKPDAESVAHFLHRFESLSEPDNRDIKHAFAKLAEAFPVEMFLMLWRRNEARKAGDASLKLLPYDFAQIRFPSIMAAPEVTALVSEFERRLVEGIELDFDETRLLRSAIQHGSDNPSAWFEAAAARATTEKQLNTLRELGSVGGDGNASLAYPEFARALLIRARAISSECYQNMFENLLHVGGGRGSTNGEPDRGWKGLLEAIERLAHQHSTDPELGPLFTAIAKHERSAIDHHRRRYSGWEENE